HLLLVLFSISAVFAAFENCVKDQEGFDSCAEIEIDRMTSNSTVMEQRDLKEAEYHNAMSHCWKKHCM
ncbi:hypothetical protein PMAYCL1PPCAC_03329, partial [Pristionchus mayeri]